LTGIKPAPTRGFVLSAIDAAWHLLNLFVPALGLGLMSAAGSKLLWRRELASVPWWRLAAAATGAAAVITLVGLWWFGQDGRMATYAAMVLAAAVALWWRGFIRRR
jgi:hypothetical protein